MQPVSANFGFLKPHGAQLFRLAALAENYFRTDPNTCLFKLRQFGELLAQDEKQRGQSEFSNTRLAEYRDAQSRPRQVMEITAKAPFPRSTLNISVISC